jgi:hypothetical protein
MAMTRPKAVRTRALTAIVAPLLLAACGGGCREVHGHPGVCAPPIPSPPTFFVFGFVSGLTGSGLTLSYKGGAPVVLTNDGAVILASKVAVGAQYSVAIASQPTNPAQTCTISNPTGAVSYFDIYVLVYCPRPAGAWAFVATAGSITTTSGVASVPGSLSTYAIDASSGALQLVAGSTLPTGPAVGTVQLVPHSPYVWALSIGDASATDNNKAGSVYVYTADPISGLLTANAGNPFFTLNGTAATPAACNGVAGAGSTAAVAFTPGGTFGYDFLGASQTQNDGTYVFAVASGVPQSLSQVPNDCDTPTVIDPSGKIAYYGTLNTTGDYTLIPSSVDPTTGALTELGGYGPPLVIPVGPGPASFDPFGRFLYSIVGQAIYGWVAIGTAGGTIQGIAGIPIWPPAGVMFSILISPDGQFAYITASDGLYTYSIDNFGLLHSAGAPVPLQIAAGQTFAAPGVTTSTQIDASGRFLYVGASAGSGQQGIYAYTRDAGTGALTPVTGSPFAVTSQTVPLQLALH